MILPDDFAREELLMRQVAEDVAASLAADLGITPEDNADDYEGLIDAVFADVYGKLI